MHKKYISWSELYLFTKDKTEYYTQYVMQLRPEATDPMKFGTIVHDAVSGKITDWKAELIKENFTSDFVRVCGELVKGAVRYPAHEVALYLKGSKANGLKCDILTIYDGLDTESNRLLERKTTANGWRTQQEVDEHGQLTIYAMSHLYILGRLPLIELERLDSGNGRIKIFQTTRTVEQIDYLREQINQMYDFLVLHGWWERRRASKDTLEKEAKANTKIYAKIRG